jgi:hypothetical protein
MTNDDSNPDLLAHSTLLPPENEIGERRIIYSIFRGITPVSRTCRPKVPIRLRRTRRNRDSPGICLDAVPAQKLEDIVHRGSDHA